MVERAAVGIHRLVIGPRLGNHHHHRVRERAAGEDEEFERVVEHRRVGAVWVDDRQDLLDVFAEEFAFEQRLARVHPVDIAAERVDFAVVREIAVRMRSLPARKGVGGKPRVHEREGGLHRGVLEVGEILVDLLGGEHAFVDECLHRQARDVPVLRAGQRGCADVGVGALADDVELALEREIVGDAGAAADEDLPHERLARTRGVAERCAVGRDRAPAEDDLTLGLDQLLETLLNFAAEGRVARQEDEAAAVFAGGRERDARAFAGLDEKSMRHLQQHAGTVAGIDLGTAGAAVVEVPEDLERVGKNLVRFAAVHIDHEAHSAGLVFEPGIVQPLLRRQAGRTDGEGAGRIAIATAVHWVRSAWLCKGEGSEGEANFRPNGGCKVAKGVQKKGRSRSVRERPGSVICGERSAWFRRSGSFWWPSWRARRRSNPHWSAHPARPRSVSRDRC